MEVPPGQDEDGYMQNNNMGGVSGYMDINPAAYNDDNDLEDV